MIEASELELPPVIRDVPGQESATAFLARAIRQPHHAYLFSGPEGSGKRLAMRAFAAALLCPNGGCGECRACRLALGERHPNMLVLEPSGAAGLAAVLEGIVAAPSLGVILSGGNVGADRFASLLGA